MPTKTPFSSPSQLAADKKSPEAASVARERSSRSSVRLTMPEAASPPRLTQRFHVAEVAESFGVKPRTVRSWIEKGLLEREKVGSSVFIRADQIEAMLSCPRTKNYP